jgi:retron-type reverse transcriptase
VLSVLSKLLEKHVTVSFMDYLVTNGLLYDLQSGFREGHFTETALIKLTDQILFDLDQDKVIGMVFVDLKKAFDVVDHHLLLTKLRLYAALSWFQSRHRQTDNSL